MKVSILAASGILAIFLSGCVLPISQPMNLPEEPIALVYWKGPSAKKRFTVFGKAAEMQPLPPNRRAPERRKEREIRAHLGAEKSLSVHMRLAEKPGRLMLFWPRTAELTKVAAAPLGSRPLAWSPDHQRLLFSSSHRGGREQLYEYHLGTKVLRRVTRGTSEHPIGTYGANGQIVAVQLRRVSDLAASEQTVHFVEAGGRLGPPIARDVPPGTIQLSPTGDRLFYEQVISHRRTGGPNVLESMIAMQAIGGDEGEALLLKGREPSLTPDGEWIVFASPSSAGYRLRRMRSDGTARVPIGPGGTEERMPSVSPDGQFVAFVRLVNGYRRLAVRRFDGRREKVLLPDGWAEFPVW